MLQQNDKKPQPKFAKFFGKRIAGGHLSKFIVTTHFAATYIFPNGIPDKPKRPASYTTKELTWLSSK